MNTALTTAESIFSGGAGIQADKKIMTAHRSDAMRRGHIFGCPEYDRRNSNHGSNSSIFKKAAGSIKDKNCDHLQHGRCTFLEKYMRIS